MNLIFELIMDLIIEGSIEVSSNKRINKWIRYPILTFLILFFTTIIFGIIFLGVVMLKENIFAGLFVIIIGLLMLIGSIIKFKKLYKIKY